MSGTLDNSALIAPFMPDEDDGDTFVYSELLDRSKKGGTSNRVRYVRAYFHRSRTEFEEQLPEMRHVAEATGARVYTRLSPRSFKTVGKLCAQLMLERVLAEQWNLMRHAYMSACGKATPLRKLWLYDVDEETDRTRAFGAWLSDKGYLQATIPSRQGVHYIVTPHDVREPANVFEQGWALMGSLHKDNPTNTYVPAGAR